MDYVCPKDLQELFERDGNAGRLAIINWMEKLPLEVGDRVWSPEGGWFEKSSPRQQ